MTDKRIKNEQWYIKELIGKITGEYISKPRFQRQKKWDVTHKKDNVPNEQCYIQFLFDTENSVHAITFGQETNSSGIYFSNIDGNNRINAICHFMNKPFEIFSDYLDNLNTFINGLDNFIENEKEKLKTIFSELSYNQIITFKYNKYFIENGYKELYNDRLRLCRDEFEPVIENIQTKLKINGTEKFDSNVKINVNIFEGYNTDELCKTFEKINKYNSKLTETELLACRLFNECNFDITDKVFKTKLEESVTKYYKNKANGEVLDCYNYDIENDQINAHDFIVGFQNLCNEEYGFIDSTDVDGLSLFFKLYKALYEGFCDTFTTKNVNDFKEKIIYSCELMKEVISSMFTDKINCKLFNKACQKKIKTLKKNNLLMLISCIVGYYNKKTEKSIIKKELEKCLLYHFMVSDIIDKVDKDEIEDFKNKDSITYRAGGGFIENATKNLLSKPETISSKLTDKLFKDLIDKLYNENTHSRKRLPDGNEKNNKRRQIKFFEKTLMFYYYKGKIPTNMLDNTFSIEHICPNSSEWEDELDKDRTGNLIPIISRENSSRGNKHIKIYKEGINSDFFQYLKDIFPDNDQYDTFVTHESGKPKITNIELYNEMCKKNEELYKNNFIESIFI
jgi:hypothetical protein